MTWGYLWAAWFSAVPAVFLVYDVFFNVHDVGQNTVGGGRDVLFKLHQPSVKRRWYWVVRGDSVLSGYAVH